MGKRKINRIRTALMGILPEFQGKELMRYSIKEPLNLLSKEISLSRN